MRDNTDVVARVKADLEARGVSLSGPCGAFEITRRVAWELRDEGAGLVSKPAGNNCNGFSVDVVQYHDGTWVDILIRSETDNVPAWQVQPTKGDPSRWVAPTQVDAVAPVPPSSSPAPPAEESVLEKLSADVERVIDVMEELEASVNGLSQRIDGLTKSGLRLRL